MTGSDVGITYIRPCVTEAGKISAEAHLGHRDAERGSSTPEFFDPAMLCWTLNGSQIFNNVKCSEKLGIAKVEMNGMTIVVSKGGRINVRKANDEDDALKATRLVSKIAWPAMICSRCGKSVSECMAGLCSRCKDASCPLLLKGPPDPTRATLRVREARTAAEILTEFEASRQLEVKEAKRNLGEALQILKGLAPPTASASSFNSVEGTVYGKLEAAKLLGQKLVAQSRRQMDASAGVALIGTAMALEKLARTVMSLGRLIRSPSDSRRVETMWRIVTCGYEDLWRSDPARVQELAKSRSLLKRTLRRARGRGGREGLPKSLETMAEAGLRLVEIASMRLAV